MTLMSLTSFTMDSGEHFISSISIFKNKIVRVNCEFLSLSENLVLKKNFDSNLVHKMYSIFFLQIKNASNMLFHLFMQHLLNIYYTPGAALGTESGI